MKRTEHFNPVIAGSMVSLFRVNVRVGNSATFFAAHAKIRFITHFYH
jgi:hypothetical protein